MNIPNPITVDGNEAVARIAHQTSDILAIYPITPASPMGEIADLYSSQQRKNLWGVVPSIVEMQSEAGAAGVLHGALPGRLGQLNLYLIAGVAADGSKPL